MGNNSAKVNLEHPSMTNKETASGAHFSFNQNYIYSFCFMYIAHKH